ncbi:amidohydrolase family protein [Streptomyces sp. NBC_01198]|uniref:amidohydrolase family protein n=1 Tax=Streptomyces sp. NBC_01198 TaxID=2903769 RepID=UPI002E0F8A20|nr:amidohydrolase family protein [Streptomyces sp. NBC_01198]
MRIDAHHHLWDLTRRPQPWLHGAALGPIARTFERGDLEPLLLANGIDATVVVQSSSSLDETRELLALAAASGGRIAGVVGWADLTDPALADVLVSLTGPLVGIRHQVQDESDPWWLARAGVRRGLATVAAAGLAYDLLVTPRELPAALETAAALPELRFVLDHAAKPRIASGGWEPWAADLRELATLPNVTCKLSGLVTEASWSGWKPADILPYAHHVLDVFGPERVLFGSDWPVCTLAATYADVVALAESATAGLSPTESASVFGTTASHVYALP